MKTPTKPDSEAADKVDFSAVRYSQCWEDADVLIEALDVKKNGSYLSIASAGDNALAIAGAGARRVVAVDLNPAQIAVTELKIEAFRRLTYTEMRDLLDWKRCPSEPFLERDQITDYKEDLYKRRVREYLPETTREFWDTRISLIREGISGIGKFERYFTTFRERLLPLAHDKVSVERVFKRRDRTMREAFYTKEWDTWRWRLIFKVFFSRFVLGRLGRDPRFFDYVEGSVADTVIKRARYALTELDPCDNSYYSWVLRGRHDEALPYILRKENFERIKANLSAIETATGSLETFASEETFDGFNLSDVFEYMSEENAESLLRKLADGANPQARFVYWNMMVPRHRPESMEEVLVPLAGEARRLHEVDKARFYERLIIEDKVG